MQVHERTLKIGVFTGSRSEYGLLHPIVSALHEAADFEPSLYVSGAHLDSRFGETLSEIQRDGLPIGFQLPLEALGESMAEESGRLTQRMGRFLADSQNRPHCLLLLGDRYETLAVAMAAFLNNVPIAHIHGGDVVRGGMLDDPIRHALTKLAHLHFPATRASADRILAMGEEAWRVTIAGSPALDNIRNIPRLEKSFFVETFGLNLEAPWVLLTQHPITTQPELAGEQARQTLSALASFQNVQVVATYPNHDAGSHAIIEQLEVFAARCPQFRVVKSLGRVRYLNLLRYVAAVVGNSSSGLLETAHFQVPCLNVGERQKDRERGGNVLDVPQEEAAIRERLTGILFDSALREKLQRAPHPFGDGHCARRILETLRNVSFDEALLQKQLTY